MKSENQEQTEFVKQIRPILLSHGRRIVAVANERWLSGTKQQRSARWRALLSAGVSPGMVDLLIQGPTPLGGFQGVAIELKRQTGGSWRPGQRGWLYYYAYIGWAAAVCCGAGEAIQLCERVGYVE